MLLSLAVILIASVGVRAQEPALISSSTGCVCVPYNLCWAHNNTIVDDGSNLLGERVGPGQFDECACPSELNPRGQRCLDVMEVCCHLPDQTVTTAAGQTTTSTITAPTTSTTSTTTTTTTTPTEEPEEEESWDECGIKGALPSETASRVINDDDDSVTLSDEFPWMAMLLEKSVNNMVCGASILHHHVVMTAAHCVRRFQAPDLVVRVGVWNRDLTAQSQTVEVERIFKHEEFGPTNYRNDLALLVLKQGLSLAHNVAPVCLPQAGSTFDNMQCIATGWGITQYGQRNLSGTLRQVQLKIVPHAQCQTEMRNTRLGPWFKLHESFVCAKGINNKDTCIGDGGGPLICQQPGSSRYLQVGIVAAGLECGNDVPALYANVPLLEPWVQQKFDEWKLKDFQ